MDNIYCGYFDEELDQVVPIQPTVNEAVDAFRNFIWKNEKAESHPKMLIFSLHPDKTGMQILVCEGETWFVSALAATKRPYFGTFFKKETFHVFTDQTKTQTEEIIRLFYSSKSVDEFQRFLVCQKQQDANE